MHYPVCIILSLAVSLKAYDYWCERGERPEECVPDGSGYVQYDCNEAEETYEKRKFTACPKDKTACRCFRDIDMENPEQRCECVSSRKRPEFPSTGVLRWNGTYVWDNEFIEPWQSFLPGEVHKDRLGRFLLKKTIPDNLGTWQRSYQPSKVMEVFEIILPHHRKGRFTKYTGIIGSKKCKTEEVDEEGKLSSIWKEDPRRYYHLIKEIPKTKDIDEQLWIQKIPADYEGEEWKLTLEFNKRDGSAIPVDFEYHYTDAWDDIKTDIKLVFTYEPIMEGDESFRLQDYCSNVYSTSNN